MITAHFPNGTTATFPSGRVLIETAHAVLIYDRDPTNGGQSIGYVQHTAGALLVVEAQPGQSATITHDGHHNGGHRE